jgi:hypothetical protein
MRIIPLFSFLLITACSSQPTSYAPAGFPAAETTHGCPKIDGSYRNLGVQQDGAGVFLSNVIGPYNAAFKKPEERALAYRRVSLMNAIYADIKSQKSGEVDVTLKAVDRDLILHPMPGKGQELVCQKGWLTLVNQATGSSLGLNREKMGFNHAVDGGLLVKRQEENVISASLTDDPEKALGWYYFPKQD